MNRRSPVPALAAEAGGRPDAGEINVANVLALQVEDADHGVGSP